MLHSYWTSSCWNSLSPPLQQWHLCVLGSTCSFHKYSRTWICGKDWSALISMSLLDQLDLQPKYAWSIIVLQGTYGKVFIFFWKVLLLANMAVLVKTVTFVSCCHTLFSNSPQNRCICNILRTFCCISECYAGLVFTVIQSSIIFFSLPSMTSYRYVLQVVIFLLKFHFSYGGKILQISVAQPDSMFFLLCF